MQIWKYNLDETQTKYLENPMNNFETRSLYWKVRANTIVWQQLQNNLNFTIRPPDGEEERVFWLKTIDLIPLKHYCTLIVGNKIAKWWPDTGLSIYGGFMRSNTTWMIET